MIRIVLIEPEIPQNTGNIGRLCVATGLHLALVGKLGFFLDNKHLKRSGMDYWQDLKLDRYNTIEEYFNSNPYFVAISTKGQKIYTEICDDYNDSNNLDLLFGSESSGLPKFIYEKFPDKLYRIPMVSTARSLNLSSAVAIVAYSILEKLNFAI